MDGDGVETLEHRPRRPALNVADGGLVSVIRDLPVWVRWLVLGHFVSALGSLAWLFPTLYLVADRGLGPAAAGASLANFSPGALRPAPTGESSS